MAESEGSAEEMDVEIPEINNEEEAMLHFGHYSEVRSAVPWEQRTFKEKMFYHVDRIFLGLLALFLLVLFGEFLYKIWYVTKWRKALDYLLQLVSFLFTQDKDEELLEL